MTWIMYGNINGTRRADDKEAQRQGQIDIYGLEKFENFVRTWQLEFPAMV